MSANSPLGTATATGAEPWRRSAPRPTRRAAVGLAVLAAASALAPLTPAIPILLATVLVGCALADWALARRFHPELERTHLNTVALRVPVCFEAAAKGFERARSVRLRQPLPSALCLDKPSVNGYQLVTELTGVRRGVHEVLPTVVRAAGPLGLSSIDHTIGRVETVRVFPDLPGARRLAAARRRAHVTDEGRIRARLGLGTDFETIRDYSPDDDIRQVNWVATARVGRPMSNQYRVDENRDLIFLVDSGRLMAAPIGELSRLDIALHALAALAVAAEDAGDRVGAIAFDSRVTRQLAPRRRGADAVVGALFDLEPAPVESDYERAFYAANKNKRALVVIFSDIFDDSAARNLIEAVPVLARHHAVLIAGCTDPDIAASLWQPAADIRGAMRQSVAADLAASHQRGVRMMQALGATVVEAQPSSLGPAAIDAYLRLKSRARI